MSNSFRAPRASISSAESSPPSYDAAYIASSSSSSPPAVTKPGATSASAPLMLNGNLQGMYGSSSDSPMPVLGGHNPNRSSYSASLSDPNSGSIPSPSPSPAVVLVSAAAPASVAAPPLVLVSNGVVVPPPLLYSPPLLDNKIAAKIPIHNTSIMACETNFTVTDFTSAEEIVAFFISQSGVPQYKLYTELSHTESHTTTDSEGNTKTESRTVVDYSFTFNPSQWIRAPGKLIGLEEGVKHFLKSSKQLRKCTLQKIVNFNVMAFGSEMKKICRERGYMHDVSTRPLFEQKSEKITIHGASGCHDVCDSNICKSLLCLTCLWICWSPMKAMVFEDNSVIRQEMELTFPPLSYARYCSQEMPARLP